jgi:hypothetical protein
MKKTIFASILTTFLFFVLPSTAQNNLGNADDVGRISLVTIVPDQVDGLTPSAKSNLENKLNQIASNNGLGGWSLNNRFILTANVAVLSKEITSSLPTMHVYTLEITFFVGDGIDGTLFASSSVSLKGVGETETKAYISALKAIKPDDPKISAFLDKGKKKILEYYNGRCDFILKEAEMLASKNDFEAAIAKLIDVPEVCKGCYDKAMNAVAPIFQKQIDRQCKIDILEATNAWNSSQDAVGAEKASEHLSRIEPNSSCYNDAKLLSDKISKRILDLDKREWNFKLKQQQDDIDIQKATIKAARDIGVAYGKNQPRNITYNYRSWW